MKSQLASTETACDWDYDKAEGKYKVYDNF